MKYDNSRLLNKIQKLESENYSLREKVDFLEGYPTMRAGIIGETIISSSINGRLTIHTSPHDVITKDGRKIEVKFSHLNSPNHKNPSSKRWSWNTPMGGAGKKDFDSLLLIGVADPRYRDFYKDPECPYVIFDVPRNDVARINQAGNHISITTNPSRAGRGNRIELFTYFQTTLRELKKKYGFKMKIATARRRS